MILFDKYCIYLLILFIWSEFVDFENLIENFKKHMLSVLLYFLDFLFNFLFFFSSLLLIINNSCDIWTLEIYFSVTDEEEEYYGAGAGGGSASKPMQGRRRESDNVRYSSFIYYININIIQRIIKISNDIFSTYIHTYIYRPTVLCTFFFSFAQLT